MLLIFLPNFAPSHSAVHCMSKTPGSTHDARRVVILNSVNELFIMFPKCFISVAYSSAPRTACTSLSYSHLAVNASRSGAPNGSLSNLSLSIVVVAICLSNAEPNPSFLFDPVPGPSSPSNADEDAADPSSLGFPGEDDDADEPNSPADDDDARRSVVPRVIFGRCIHPAPPFVPARRVVAGMGRVAYAILPTESARSGTDCRTSFELVRTRSIDRARRGALIGHMEIDSSIDSSVVRDVCG